MSTTAARPHPLAAEKLPVVVPCPDATYPFAFAWRTWRFR